MALVAWDDVKASYRPRITIREAGTLAFSSGATNKFGLGTHVTHVTLAYDETDGTIVIAPAGVKDRGAIALTKPDRAAHYVSVINIRNFCDRFGIDRQRSRKFLLRNSTRIEGAFEFNLNEELSRGDGGES